MSPKVTCAYLFVCLTTFSVFQAMWCRW